MVRLLSLLLLLLLAQSATAQPLPALIPYRTKAGWGYSDSTGKLVIPAIYSGVEFFQNGKARTYFGERDKRIYCLIDEKGRYLIPPAYHWSGQSNPLSYAGSMNVHDGNGNWGVVDTVGRLLIPLRYRRPGGYSPNGVLLDSLGRERLPEKWSYEMGYSGMGRLYRMSFTTRPDREKSVPYYSDREGFYIDYRGTIYADADVFE